MTISVQHQLKLLQDILDEHQTAGSGSVAEYQQLKRLARSILSKEEMTDDAIINQLQEIYHYGQKGESAHSQPVHITEHYDAISGWVNTINNNVLK